MYFFPRASILLKFSCQTGNMKKTFFLSLLFFFFLAQLQAQQPYKNMAKINVSSIVLKGINLQYERQVASRWTVALGYSSIPKSSIAFKNVIDNYFDGVDINFGDFKLGTSIFTPEVRYYVGKRGAFHGFYLAPYARIGKYNIDGPIQFFSGADRRTVIFSGDLNAVTGGLMIGSQFRLSNRLHLDWWIIGGSFGGGKGTLVAATPLSQAEQRDLKRELDRLDVPFTTIESDVNSNGATVRTSGNMAGVRGLGLNIGFRF